jgi:hypothetical protein
MSVESDPPKAKKDVIDLSVNVMCMLDVGKTGNTALCLG